MLAEVLVIIVLGVVLLVLSVLSQVALWQRKEYRWDRLWVFVRSNEWYVTYGMLVVGLAVALDIGWLAYIFSALVLAQAAGWVALIVLIAYHGWRVYWRGVYRPKSTTKSQLIIGVIGAISIMYIWLLINTLDAFALQWATFIVSIPIITALAVLFVNLATEWRKRAIITEAKTLRASLADLTVVGITGSFGKTSTKHFLDEILTSAKVKHDISTEHRNEELVVAQDILQKLSADSRVYVVEMGAYRIGEIERLAILTKPVIGIVTAIGNQHVGLFGSLKNLVNAKWELIKSLPSDGIAILNADDPVIAKKGKKSAKKVLWYSTKHKANIYASNIVIEGKLLSAEVHIGEDKKNVAIPLISVVLESVLAAVTAAVALGVKSVDIFKAIERLTPVARTMELCAGLNKSTLIDDSYSGNEAGVLAAVKHLDYFPDSQKVIVMTPLIELGTDAPDVHYRIGQALAKSGAETFIFGTAHREDLKRGAGEASVSIHFIAQPKKLLQTVRAVIKPTAVILLEGRIPDMVRQGLRK